MSHTQSSQTYRKHYVPGHEQQCFASMMAMRHLMRYQGAVVRHRKRLILALKRMEQVGGKQ